MRLENLTSMQIDFLKELTNIGGGNAATALSQMVNRPIKMEIPTVKLLPYQKLFSDIMKEEELVNAISIRILGDVPGTFLFILKEKDCLDLIEMLTGNIVKSLDFR